MKAEAFKAGFVGSFFFIGLTALFIVRSGYSAAPTPSSSPVAFKDASKEHPWENSLGMNFVPVPGTKTLFGVWDTRVQDFAAFVRETKYDAPGTELMDGSDTVGEVIVIPNRGDNWEHPGFNQGPTHPVVRVSWNDAKAFCAWLTNKEHVRGVLPQDKVYRLPTDAEWSIAVGLGREPGNTAKEKDGRIKIYPWGTEWPPPTGAGNYSGEEMKKDKDLTNSMLVGYNDGWPYTSPVGSFMVNQFGLYDLGGNVEQWCEDWYDEPDRYRVLRGASWIIGDPESLLSSRRDRNFQTNCSDIIGFRCVVSPEPSW